MWVDHKDFLGIVTNVWSALVSGSPFFVWEEKIRRMKKALKVWAKSIDSPNQRKVQAMQALDIHQTKMESKIIDKEDINKEINLQRELHVACRHEAEMWRQKARCR